VTKSQSAGPVSCLENCATTKCANTITIPDENHQLDEATEVEECQKTVSALCGTPTNEATTVSNL